MSRIINIYNNVVQKYKDTFIFRHLKTYLRLIQWTSDLGFASTNNNRKFYSQIRRTHHRLRMSGFPKQSYSYTITYYIYYLYFVPNHFIEVHNKLYKHSDFAISFKTGCGKCKTL